MRRLAVLIVFAVAAAGCGTAVAIQSFSPDQPVTVDAQLTEWVGKLRSIDGGNLSVGVQNDTEYLYVAVSTSSPYVISQIMNDGMILWIDAAGGDEKTFGVRYPIGYAVAGGSSSGPGNDPTANRLRLEQSLNEIDLLGKDGQASRRRKNAVPGIEVQAQADERVLTYEAKVPLAPGEGIAYAIGTEPGREIGVGLTTPEIEGSNLAQQQGAGGLPGGRMSSADGRGSFRVPNNLGLLPPMKEWLHVTLTD